MMNPQPKLAAVLQELYESNQEINKNHLALSPREWSQVFDCQPLSVAIEKQYGGIGVDTQACLKILETASYHSVSLTLIFGINIALFLEPLAKYGSDSVKSKVLTNFLDQNHTGGLMISEPKFGTDAMNMETTFMVANGKVKIEGVKQWQGLTGQASFWLVAGRLKKGDKLDKNVSFCVVPQELIKYELYKTQGLNHIQYGLNTLSLEVPEENILLSDSENGNIFMNIINRSRMQFPGMALGLIKRNLHNTIAHATERLMRSKPLSNVPSVAHHIQLMQVYETVISSFCYFSSTHSAIENELAERTIIANAIKVLATEFMEKSATLSIQLSGGNGFLKSHFGFTSLIDARPFKIFEGPNDMLTAQIARLAKIDMRKSKIDNIFQYIELMTRLDIKFDATVTKHTIDISRRKWSLSQSFKLGQILTMLVAIQMVTHLSDIGYSPYLIENAQIYLRNKLHKLIHTFELSDGLLKYEDIRSDWVN